MGLNNVRTGIFTTLSLWGIVCVYVNSASHDFESYIEIVASRIVI